jgi:hypothetical protein
MVWSGSHCEPVTSVTLRNPDYARCRLIRVDGVMVSPIRSDVVLRERCCLLLTPLNPAQPRAFGPRQAELEVSNSFQPALQGRSCRWSPEWRGLRYAVVLRFAPDASGDYVSPQAKTYAGSYVCSAGGARRYWTSHEPQNAARTFHSNRDGANNTQRAGSVPGSSVVEPQSQSPSVVVIIRQSASLSD